MRHARSRRHSHGATVVEFAIIAAALLFVLLAVIDLSRIVFLRMTLEEGVRRGARLAAVCPIGDPLPAASALFSAAASSGAQVTIDYLDQEGIALNAAADNFASIRFVRVRLQGIEVPLLVPFVSRIFSPNSISSTSVAESLGVAPTGSKPC
jgi:Flp pilus assembly protein TadG